MTDKIYSIILIILSIVCCKQCTSDYLKGGDSKAISHYEKMIFDNSQVSAELYPDYKEVTIKIMRMPIKTYEFRYHFNISGNQYEGQHTFESQLPKLNIINVYYLKDDPNFNCVNPKEKLKLEKEKNSSKKDLYWGIGWGILGLLSILSFFNKGEKKEN